MDLSRRALEPARTAREALDVITRLLEHYGQGGNCGFQHKLYYHNSFIIADPKDAWVLQTAGRQWAAEQVKDICTISNGITIGAEWDLASDDLVKYAIDRGWCKGRDDFHFGRCYSDFIYTRFSYCKDRQCRTTDLLAAQKGRITLESIVRALRDHGEQADENWTPARGLNTVTVCWHAGFGPIRGSQSVGSMVSHLAPEVQTHYVTGTSAPCTSVFKPVWLGVELPNTGPSPTGEYDAATLFWRHELLHRATLRDYAARLAAYRHDRDALEQRFIQEAQTCRGRPLAERAILSARCFAEADEAERDWLDRIRMRNLSAPERVLYTLAWRAANRSARLPAI